MRLRSFVLGVVVAVAVTARLCAQAQQTGEGGRDVSRFSAISCAMSAAIASASPTLVGPGGDAHVYAPTPADAQDRLRGETRRHQRPRL